MTADEMFKELGYTKKTGIAYPNGELKTITYEIEGVDGIYVWFYLDSKTLTVETDTCDIDMNLLQAIYQQCRELGWLE